MLRFLVKFLICLIILLMIIKIVNTEFNIDCVSMIVDYVKENFYYLAL